MEEMWKRARVFAEEAAKKSQTLTTSGKFADLVAETAKKSKELALEASKKADQLKDAALKQADQIHIKSFSDIIPSQFSSISISSSSWAPEVSDEELRKFGITDDLRDFVKGLASSTFQNFPIQDEAEQSDVPTTASNVRKDLTEWQERHATLVLSTVKAISRLRYELCPRVMKERRFWRIYFTLVSTHVAPYERDYMEEVRRKAEEQMKDDEAKQIPTATETSRSELTEKNLKSKTSTASSEQDLDTFLLGDLEDSDGGADDADGSYDDDFDKIDNSDIEDEKHTKKSTTAEE
ncbi:hypothetical protein K2173_016999 [Erythroxylum novogranatense]|uniref:BSD domain-containing protein n=1 Tax=Erythroxylum novogranatense TaxID=1862640 RepID=A0AAV8U5L9_9ROSI|nr:hypothetical protein K2173_016999 [Erythroxylum novogranatense]